MFLAPGGLDAGSVLGRRLFDRVSARASRMTPDRRASVSCVSGATADRHPCARVPGDRGQTRRVRIRMSRKGSTRADPHHLKGN